MLMINNTSKLRVRRGYGWADKLRGYKILVNGAEVGVINHGSVFELEVPSGSLIIQGRIDWCRSSPLKVKVDPGQTIEIVISNDWPLLLALWAYTFGSRNLLTLKRIQTS